MSQMTLGWWRARDGGEYQIVRRLSDAYTYPWRSLEELGWDDNGRYLNDGQQDQLNLIEFLRPLEELAPKLNSSVKAAEDRVRQLKQMVDETQTAWATACRLHEAARKELERLEKECEVKP